MNIFNELTSSCFCTRIGSAPLPSVLLLLDLVRAWFASLFKSRQLNILCFFQEFVRLVKFAVVWCCGCSLEIRRKDFWYIFLHVLKLCLKYR